MHPIERLRLVARSQSAPPDALVAESAAALQAFNGDSAGMVSACRRIVDRHPKCSPLWWLCARILTSPEPMLEARCSVEDMENDPTAKLLAGEVPSDALVVVPGWPEQSYGAWRRRGDLRIRLVDVDGEAAEAARQLRLAGVAAEPVSARNLSAALEGAQLVLIESFAVGPESALVPAGAQAAEALARRVGLSVWLMAGVGRMLPASMFDALADRWKLSVDPTRAPEELMDTAAFDAVACRGGVFEPHEALTFIDCPVAPELFKAVI